MIIPTLTALTVDESRAFFGIVNISGFEMSPSGLADNFNSVFGKCFFFYISKYTTFSKSSIFVIKK